ncbi:4-methyl-5(b-hydroxyethyl)-thiazole monophosphate biosynthesis [Butyrivibrio fibrisolvens DSM 3071]|uniref:4-methyl-5(B-hydroxyethyl)-thiazole monophosphate biosynthesis n=1 Tax=Butyrivibrio fibrisolvens DSM 3071 TaxID=1121131 RepID=A0A1M5WSI2_BUTFI|nr:DJ-1/PfpI family protein [Butyrivibrio fibrisolvens]SHH90585.1 4-methyl-5(b-hydroxyethyl)-thiazole monophosphate biosynthesis [Butyrivibrio fibrisolvens DSM 3071]
MKVLLFCCKGFETMEFAPFVDVMGWARNDYDMPVEVVTAGFSKTVISTFGIPILVDKSFDEIDVSEYDALAIPGGFEEFGFYEEAYDKRFLNLIREFERSNKFIASICVGALPIGASGILKGRKATTYHLGDGRRQKQLAEFGVDVIPDQSVVIDKNIITSFCPETAPHVAIALLRMLMGEDKAQVVAKAMGF